MNVWYHFLAQLPSLKRYVSPDVKQNAENTKRLLTFNTTTKSFYLLIEYDPLLMDRGYIPCLFSLHHDSRLVEAHTGNLLDITTFTKIDGILSSHFIQSNI